jgi:hypothetical protein
MELVGLLSKVVKENLTTRKILLEYPESTIKKLVDKFSKQTEDTEDDIRKTIADFERFKAAFDNEDKDIFRHSYEKIKSLIADKATKQKSKKDLEGMVQDYLEKWRGTVQVDLQLTKLNIKKFFEVKTHFPQLKEFKREPISYNPSQLNELVGKYFSKFNNQGINELVAAITQKFHEENPDEDAMTTFLPRAKRFVKHFELIPLNAKLSKFMNFEEFEHIVDGYTPMEESEYTVPEIDLSDVNIPYEDDDVLIFAPDQKHKCINIRKKHAPDRRWCTSWEGSGNYYYNYRLNQNLTLYYIINKNLPSSDLNYATVILVDRYGDMRLADGSNSGRYAGSTVIPWSEITKKVPVLDGKKQYLEAKPYTDEDQAKLQRYKSYSLRTTDPLAELGSEEEVELWMELRSPDFSHMHNGDEIFGNLPEELQKKYIGLGNELSAGMVRVLSPSGMSYYVSKKKEKLLQKSLKDLSENDMEVVLSKEMKPYLRSLKEKYRNELATDFKPNFVGINYPSDANAKYARMFGLEELFDLIPEDTRFLQIENKSKDKVILKIPASISKFQNVRTLVFENIIDELPAEIGELKRLSFLNLTNNEKLTTLPESITEIYCLDFISVLGSDNLVNGIENLPEKVKNFFDISPGATLWDTNRPDEYFDLCDEAEQAAP